MKFESNQNQRENRNLSCGETLKTCTLCVSRVLKYSKKVFLALDNGFHVYLMSGLQKYEKKSLWLFEI